MPAIFSSFAALYTFPLPLRKAACRLRRCAEVWFVECVFLNKFETTKTLSNTLKGGEERYSVI